MKKFIIVALAIVVMFVLATSAFAVGPGKTVEYQKGGKVIFDGKTHAAKAKCNDCHPAIFKMKKGAEMTMKDMEAGKYCGTCHNGTKAFGVNDPAQCAKCHKK